MSNYQLGVQRVAELAANRAGQVILHGFGSVDLNRDVISKIGSRDIVTNTDKLAQETIRTTFRGISES